MRRRALLCTAATTLALGACGGGGDEGPTRAEYAKDANAVCRDIERDGKSLSKASPNTLDEIVTFVDRAERTVKRGMDRLQKLERPSGEDGKKAKAFVDQLQRELDTRFLPALGEMRTAAKAGDVKGLKRAADKLGKLESTKSDQLARDIGLDDCAD